MNLVAAKCRAIAYGTRLVCAASSATSASVLIVNTCCVSRASNVGNIPATAGAAATATSGQQAQRGDADGAHGPCPNAAPIAFVVRQRGL